MKSVLAISTALLLFGAATHSDPKPEQKLSHDFLSELDSLLQSDAGSTSFTRMSYPTLHGRSRFNAAKETEKAVADLWAKLDADHTLTVLSYGNFDNEGTPPSTKFMYGCYQINNSDFVDGMPYAKAEKELVKLTGPAKAKELWESGKESLEFTMPYASHTVIVEMKVVKANSDQCSSCHSGATKGSRVGIVALVRIPD